MTKEKQDKSLKVDSLRHAEYYGMQEKFDELYANSKNGEIFENLMDTILSEDNILLAYRNLKTNQGSNTPGTDGLTISVVGNMSPEDVIKQVRFIVTGSKHGYRPKPVRRKDIPKSSDPSKTRPLGIPCIWDRLVQQCIKQVLEPICEAKFSENSYGFRPGRSVENAISATYMRLNVSAAFHVIEFDIKGFFDNVNHSKLIKQIWAFGIHDKHLIYVLKQILKAPIKLENGEIEIPTKGTPQGGIISPLLANIVLNELDHWVESQWQAHPATQNYKAQYNKNGIERKTNAYRAMRTTNLKEMYIIRYADDFRIFCKTKTDAVKTKTAITKWLKERLRLEVSEEKTRIVNVKRKNMEFLGFKIKVRSKGTKYRVVSHMGDNQFEKCKKNLTTQATNIAKPRPKHNESMEVMLYDEMVVGIQNYYQIATHISEDCSRIAWHIEKTLYNRLTKQGASRYSRTGGILSDFETKRYGKSKQIRFISGSRMPIYPIGYVKHKHPQGHNRAVCPYTTEGRLKYHNALRINKKILRELLKQRVDQMNVEYHDNRLSLYCAQYGRCAITGREFVSASEIHCHHKTPKSLGGSDKYNNLTLVLKDIHRLIHAKQPDTIRKYLEICKLNKDEIARINNLRKQAGRDPI